MSAASVKASTVSNQEAGAGSTPSAALQSLFVRPVPHLVAKQLIEQQHYLHSLPGGTHLAFGVFIGRRLVGALTLGAGPYNAPSLVEGATASDCLTLTRFWLSSDLPANSESRVLGVVARALRRNTSLKFLLSYADPTQGHIGTIYQAAGWLYTGMSEPMPLYNVGDGRLRHSRSLSHAYGTHSLRHFARHGVKVEVINQGSKHRYLQPLDPTWINRIRLPILPYPKHEA